MSQHTIEQERVLKVLSTLDPLSPEYKTALFHYKMLADIAHQYDAFMLEFMNRKHSEQEKAKLASKERNDELAKYWKGIRKEVIVSALAQVGATLMVLNFERVGIITSKAFRMPKG